MLHGSLLFQLLYIMYCKIHYISQDCRQIYTENTMQEVTINLQEAFSQFSFQGEGSLSSDFTLFCHADVPAKVFFVLNIYLIHIILHSDIFQTSDSLNSNTLRSQACTTDIFDSVKLKQLSTFLCNTVEYTIKIYQFD